MTFHPLQKMLPAAIQKHGLANAISSAELCHHAEKILQEIFPHFTREHVRPLFMKNDTLTIGVTHPAYGQEIFMKRDMLIEKLRPLASPLVGSLLEVKTVVL